MLSHNNHQNQRKNQEIKNLEEEISNLREYLFSDCCKQCQYIVNKINQYEEQLHKLIYEYIG
jgi:uncharacterized protein YutD